METDINNYRYTLVDADKNIIDRCEDYESACGIAGDYATAEQESAFILDNEATQQQIQCYQVDPDCMPRAVRIMGRVVMS